MTALQVPDILSLLGNMKNFKFSTTEEISFILMSGSDKILEQSYTPGADGFITVDLKDVLRAQLNTQFSDSSVPYKQSSLVKNFTVTVGTGYSYSFSVIRAGVDHLNDSTANFLTNNFLTWQPNMKGVTYYSPEFLTYYAAAASVCKCKVYTSSSSSTLTLASIPEGEAWTIPVQYAIIAGKSNVLPQYYDVWVEDAAGNRLTYIQRYYAQDMKSENEQWMIFINSLGGIDTFRAYGVSENSSEHTHNIAEIDEISYEYRVDTERKFKKNTGYLTKKERLWLLDFFPSLQKFIYISNYVRQVVTIESDVTYRDKELPSNFTFTYKYADAVPYLNIPRTEAPTDVLNIEVPTIGSFTLAPRLVEFQRATLTDGALFPVQNPYSEGWNVTTAAALRDFMAATLTNNYAGGGGIGHTHNNLDLLQLFTFVSKYLLIGGEKIKAGTSDLATFASNLAAASSDWAKILRKDQDDSTPFNFGVGKNLTVGGDNSVSGKSVLKDDVTVGTYNPGITGSGSKIDKDGNAEMRNLILWETLQVPQLSFNRVEVLIGMDFQCSGGGLIESVTIDKDADGNSLSSGTVKLHLEEGEYGSVKVGDFCMGIFHNFGGVNDTESSDSHTGNITKMGFLTSYFYITEITNTSTNGEFKYILREVSDSWTQQNHPSEHMNFAQRGNNIDTTRQSFKYRTTEYSIGLTGVNSWEFSDSNIYYLEGKLDGWTIGGKTFEGYGSVIGNTYIYGKIDQFEKVGYLMTFDGGGDTLISQGEIKTISAIIKDGYGLDVTNLFTDWTIVRNTGNTASDNIWNAQATINNGVFNITWSNSKDDLGGNNLALFTVTANKGSETVSGTLQI